MIINTPATKSRIHPLMAVAAASVILVSMVGVAAISGWLPNSHGSAAAEINPVTASAPATGVPVASNSNAGTSVPQHHVAAHKTHVAPASSGTYLPPVAHAQQACSNCGIVESVRTVAQPIQQGSGVGAVTGALLGGVLGNNVGSGNGRKLATVAGAIGGGFAGNEVEKRTRTTTHYEIRVRMEDGSMRTFNPSTAPGWNAGDHVRIVDGALTSQG